MATTKRSKRGRAAATRAKSTSKSAPSTAKKRPPARVAKAKAAKTKAAAQPKRAIAAKPSPKGKAVAAESSAMTALKAKFQRERKQLEKNLTEAVREIGLLRHHELRATQFERQLADRDATIGRLQAQLADLERRPVEPVYVHEVQQSLALGGSAHDVEPAMAADLDEFEDEVLADEGGLVSDED